jgi:hypothetical protein
MTNNIADVTAFWACLDQTGGPDACWPHPWPLTASVRIGGRRQRAQRWAHEIHTGRPLPKNLCLVAECGNQRCCNPTHLAAATRADVLLRRESPNVNNVASGCKNVYRARWKEGWTAKYVIGGRAVHLGQFDSVEQAAAAVDHARAAD